MKKRKWHFICLIIILIVISLSIINACNPSFMEIMTNKIGRYGESNYGNSVYGD